VNGLLLIDKSQGMTSHDVVARVRRLIGIRAIGHAGTLDPFATGLLILCIGHATRLSEYLIGETKTYAARMRLGERTNTDDIDGEVVQRRDVRVSPADLERARAAFIGEIMQIPPQYSAIQIGGQRAYKLARQGETVDIPARQVTIKALELHLISNSTGAVDEAEMRVTCTSGTYVRALARDIGEMLGCGAHLMALCREQSGDFNLAEAISLDALKDAGGDWPRYLLPMDRAVMHLDAAHLDAIDSARFLSGQFVLASAQGTALRRVYAADGAFVAIGQYDMAANLLKPAKVFHARE
jgi:tRNA pseudouridine55 synthase